MKKLRKKKFTNLTHVIDNMRFPVYPYFVKIDRNYRWQEEVKNESLIISSIMRFKNSRINGIQIDIFKLLIQ